MRGRAGSPSLHMRAEEFVVVTLNKLLPQDLESKMTLKLKIHKEKIYALVNSGAEGNFIQPELAKSLRAVYTCLNRPKRIYRADGKLIGTVDETATLPVWLRSNVNTYIMFLVAPISLLTILGMPWIIDHDGKINTVDWMLELSFGKIRAVLPCTRELQNEQSEHSFVSSINLAMYKEIIALEEVNEIANLEIVEFADKILQINEVGSTAKAVTDAHTLMLIKC